MSKSPHTPEFRSKVAQQYLAGRGRNMTIKEIKAIVKARYGNVEAGKAGCGNPTHDSHSEIAGEVRYFKLSNAFGSGFVARIRIKWEKYETITENGNAVRIVSAITEHLHKHAAEVTTIGFNRQYNA